MPSTIVCSGVMTPPLWALLSRNVVQSVAMATACISWTNSLSAWSLGAVRCAVAKPSSMRIDTPRAAISRRTRSSRLRNPFWRSTLNPLM